MVWLFGEVDLAGVAGDDHLRIVPEPCQKHQHLARGRVLGLVEDDDAVVERPPAHERQRDHLDHVVDHEPFDLLEVHHVVERVEQRPEVRVDLGLQIARQKAEPLARFHGGPGQYDPTRLTPL